MRKNILYIIMFIIMSMGAMAYTIDGDSVYAESQYVKLTVTPHTKTFGYQTLELSSKSTPGYLCAALIFNTELLRINDRFTHIEHNDKHIYYTEDPLYFDPFDTRSMDIDYDIYGSGKFDVIGWSPKNGFSCRDSYLQDEYYFKHTLDPWYNNAFEFCKNITILGSNETLIDFPHYIVIDNTTDFYEDGAGGFKIINHSCNEGSSWQELDFEVENYTTNNIDLWVRANSTTATKYWSVYYNSTDSNDYSSPEDVWKNGFNGTWHYHNRTGTTASDSTTAAKDMTLTNGAAFAAGSIDGAVDLDGTNDYTNVTAAYNLLGNTDWTIEGWLTTDTMTSKNTYTLYGQYVDDNNRWGFDMTGPSSPNSDGFRIFIRQSGSTVVNTHWAYTHKTGSPQYYVMRKDGSNYSLFINGSLYNSVIDASAINSNNGAAYVSRLTYSSVSADNFHNGKIDDMRISKTAHSEGWINYTYHLIINQDDLVTVGNQEEAPPPIIEYHSMQSSNLELDDVSFASSDKLELYRVEYNASFTDMFFMWSLNIEKLSGGGSNQVECDFIIDDSLRQRETITYVSTTNQLVSSGSIVNISTAAGLHNLSINCSRTGTGTISLSEIDGIIVLPHDQDGDIFNADVSYGNFTHSATSFTDALTFDVNKQIDSGTYYITKMSVTKTTTGMIDYAYRNLNNSFISPYWTRYISTAGGQGNLLGLFMNTSLESNHTMSFYSRVNGGTATVNYTHVNYDLMDINGHILNANYSTDPISTISAPRTYTAGLNKIASSEITMLDGSGVYISAQASFGTSTGGHTPQLYINSTNSSPIDCEYRKYRALSSNSDRGNAFIFGSCYNMTVNNTYGIDLYINVSTGENVLVYDEVLTLIESNYINVTPQDTPPIFIENIPSFAVYQNDTINYTGNFSAAYNVSFDTNCTFLNTSISNITDDYNIFWNASTIGTFYCIGWLYEPETGFNTTSDPFTITVSAIPTPPTPSPDEYEYFACDYDLPMTLFLIGFCFIVVLINIFVWKMDIPIISIIIGIATAYFSLYIWGCATWIGLMMLLLGFGSMLKVFT